MLELFNQLDGFESCNTNIIDRKIEFPAPKSSARLEILKIDSRNMIFRHHILDF